MTDSLNQSDVRSILLSYEMVHILNATIEPDMSETWSNQLLGDLVYDICQIVVRGVLILIVGCLGMVANVVNIVVFCRIGVMSDSNNVSLLGLAVADFGGLASSVLLSVMTVIQLNEVKGLNFDPESVLYIAAGWPHVMFAQMSCWITAFIAFERCMCVVFPFKVKMMFSAKRSLIVVSCIMLYFVLSYLPIFITQQLQWRLDPRTNTTRLIAVFAPYYQKVDEISHYINSIISPTVSMAIVLICTKFTASGVHSSSKWRMNLGTADNSKSQPLNAVQSNDQSTISEPKANQMSTNASAQKERRLIKMITIICIVFIVCNLPGIVTIYLRKAVPEIRHHGVYHNLFHVLYGCIFFLETINSSVNIVVYYRLSTRYRQVFRSCFRLK